MKPLTNKPDSQIATLAAKKPAGDGLESSCHKPWGIQDVFTPCVVVPSLLKNFHSAASNTSPGYVILFSPASSSIDQFGKNQGTEELRTRSASALAPTIGGRISNSHPYMQTVAKKRQAEFDVNEKNLRFGSGFFEEKTRVKNNNPQNIPQHERTLTSANAQ